MITDRLVKMLAFRIRLMNFSLCSTATWDQEKNRMKASIPFHFWNWGIVIFGTSFYTLTVIYRIYVNAGRIFGAQDETEDDMDTFTSPKSLSTTMIHFTIDSLCGVFIVFALALGMVIIDQTQNLIQLANGILDLNNWMMETLHAHNGYQPDHGGNSGRKTEFILAMLNTGSVALPLFYGLFLLHPYEPAHRSLVEWLEITPQLNLSFLPIMLVADWGIYFCGNVIYFPVSICILYIVLCQFWIPGISPHSTVKYQGEIRYVTDLGLIDENHLIKLYRCQQVSNVLMNGVMKSSIFFGLHHALILCMFVLGTLLCIKYTENVLAMGAAGIILPAAAFAAMLIEYHETHLLGKILWDSREFIRMGNKTCAQSGVLRRFFLSCTDIKMQTAYPFFVISFDTFLLLLHQGIDFLVQLLVL